jgi:hypothetical protein
MEMKDNFWLRPENLNSRLYIRAGGGGAASLSEKSLTKKTDWQKYRVFQDTGIDKNNGNGQINQCIH